MFYNNTKAFTLVELIVVITIVGILSTIGFVSYSGYLTGARDSNRTSQMVKLSDSLQVYGATKTLPLPDNYVEIEASGSLIAYQGEVGVDVLETIDYTNGGTDPKDGEYYTYYLTKDRKSMQLLAMMEEQSLSANTNPLDILQDVHAADYSDRFAKVYGRKLGALTQETTNTPIQQLSTFSATPFEITTETGYTAHISDQEKVTGTVAGDLSESIPKGSCKRIKQTGGASGNGTYTINPGGTGEVSVYCDMETAGGGWTLIARSYSGSTATNFGWLQSFGSISDDNEAYSMGVNSQNLSFDSILLGSYTSGKNIGLAIRIDVNDNELKNSTSTSISITSCEDIVGNSNSGCDGATDWGFITKTTPNYVINSGGGNNDNGLRMDRIEGSNKGDLDGLQGAIFVK